MIDDQNPVFSYLSIHPSSLFFVEKDIPFIEQYQENCKALAQGNIPITYLPDSFFQLLKKAQNRSEVPEGRLRK